jgi:hypothetical protein
MMISAIVCHIKIQYAHISHTVPTERNLTPQRTQSEPRVRSLDSLLKILGSLWVPSGFTLNSLSGSGTGSFWVRFGIALGLLWVRFLLGCVRSVLYVFYKFWLELTMNLYFISDICRKWPISKSILSKSINNLLC